MNMIRDDKAQLNDLRFVIFNMLPLQLLEERKMIKSVKLNIQIQLAS